MINRARGGEGGVARATGQAHYPIQFLECPGSRILSFLVNDEYISRIIIRFQFLQQIYIF
jgi:hypothetical protein